MSVQQLSHIEACPSPVRGEPAAPAGGPETSRDDLRGVRFHRVTKVFRDGTRALDPTSFTVAEGEFVAVVGPSGCGKSTLLRLAAGLTEPTQGQAETTAGSMGYVFQDPTLLPWRTVQRNVELLAELAGRSREERRRLAAEAIALTGLAGFERHLPRALSGGMRMRVSLARALTLRPSTFLFDEPFGALDEITREHLNGELNSLFVRERFAGLFITHSVTEAVFLADRVLVMSARPGRIVADIAVPFDHPRDPGLRFDPALGRVAARVSGALRGHAR
jgi:NitT/TauT family transport system ATP-binding protein